MHIQTHTSVFAPSQVQLDKDEHTLILYIHAFSLFIIVIDAKAFNLPIIYVNYDKGLTVSVSDRSTKRNICLL